MTKTITIERYTDGNNEYRWRARAANGRIVADSSEGYKNARHRDHMVRVLFGDVYPGTIFKIVDR